MVACCRVLDAAPVSTEVLDALCDLAVHLKVESDERAWLRGWLAGERAHLGWSVSGVADVGVIEDLDRSKDPTAVAACLCALARHPGPVLGLTAAAAVPAVRNGLMTTAGVGAVGPTLVAVAAVDVSAALALLRARIPPPTAPEATFAALAVAARTATVPQHWEAVDAVDVADDDLDDDDFDDDAGPAERLPLVLAPAAAAAAVRWADWLDAVSRKPLTPRGPWQERWRGRDLRRLGTRVAASAAHSHLQAGRYGDVAAVIAAAGGPQTRRLHILSALARARVADAAGIGLPASAAGRKEQVSFFEEDIRAILSAARPDEIIDDPWVLRQVTTFLILAAVAREDAGAVMRTYAVLARRGLGSADISWAAALALAVFPEGPIASTAGEVRGRWVQFARTCVARALLEGYAPEFEELDEVCAALGVPVDSVRSMVEPLLGAVNTAVGDGEGTTLVVLADGPGLGDGAAPGALALAALIEAPLLALAASIDEEVEIPAECAWRSVDVGAGPGVVPVPGGYDLEALAEDDDAEVGLLSGILAGHLVAAALEERLDAIDAALEAAAQAAAAPPMDKPAPVAPATRPAHDARRTEERPLGDATSQRGALAGVDTGDRAAVIAAVRALDGETLSARESDQLAAVVAGLDDATLDEVWLGALGEGTGLWGSGVHVELERARVWARRGRSPEAAAVLQALGARVRAAGGRLSGVRLEDLAPLAAAVGASLPPPPPGGPAGDPAGEVAGGGRPVHVVFVGGNETQARYADPIDAELEERHGGRVRVTWVHPGWATNWSATAHQVEALLDEADALVLMRFVRTNLGRHLRRISSSAGIPWVACTGHGKASLMASIEEAVGVIDAR
ncbi:MAG: hypothetical protein ACRD03_09125 [Acidimicrobiales bacterium]